MNLEESISYKEVYLKAFSLSPSKILKSVVSEILTNRIRVPSVSIEYIFLWELSRCDYINVLELKASRINDVIEVLFQHSAL